MYGSWDAWLAANGIELKMTALVIGLMVGTGALMRWFA